LTSSTPYVIIKTVKEREVNKMSYTVEFILTSILMSLTVGSYMAIFIVNIIAENSKSIIKWIMGIILAIAIGCGIGGLVTLQNKDDDEAWNNGYCTECNKPYKFTSTVHHRSGDDEYYYTCDKCGHTIVTHSLKER
jgi:hypothetical protein